MSQKGPIPVDVNPGMRAYRVLQSFPYNEIGAISELIDNSIQSFENLKASICKADKGDSRLKIEIDIDTKKRKITMRDNAGGIRDRNLQKAMQLGLDEGEGHRSSSLSAYGAGMKTAAVWFTGKWELKTASLGSGEELTLLFDLSHLLKQDKTDVTASRRSISASEHYTIITFLNCQRNLTREYWEKKVFPSLLQIFHRFNVDIEITHDDMLLKRVGTKKLFLGDRLVPLKHEGRVWKKEIQINLKSRKSASGFIQILRKGSQTQPGIRLYRNNRVIEGTTVKRNLPENITGTSNKHRAQRIYGELDLKGFKVNFQKTGFDDGLEPLYAALEEKVRDIMDKAERYRPRSEKQEKPKTEEQKKQQKGAASGQSAKKRKKENKIEYSPEVEKHIKRLKGKGKKLLYLYKSLCSIDSIEHNVLAYAGAWSFFETLAKLGPLRGKDDRIPFPTALDDFTKGEKYAEKGFVQEAMGNISRHGNISKHSRNYKINGEQLIWDFKQTEELVVLVLQKITNSN